MSLRRGFKSDANALAVDVRSEIGLTPIAPLDPIALAEHLEIPVVRLSQGGYDAEVVTHFTRTDPSAFSAATVFDGSRRIIVHNDSHSAGRQANNLAHEISHGLLLHPPTPALGAGGCREWSSEVEEEASWLAGVLLVTEEAALRVIRSGASLAAAAQYYGVSKPLMNWRINVTGARTRVARTQAKRDSVVRPGTRTAR